MDIKKPKEFYLKQPYRFHDGGVEHKINVGLYGIVKYVVMQHSFPGLSQEIAIFDTLNEAERARNQWDLDSDLYTNYSVKRVILS